jgi:hypothetical protein
MDKRALFKKLGKAKSTKKDNQVRQGKYRFIVRALRYFVSENTNQDTFVLELFTKQSESIPGAIDRDTGKPEFANPVGTTCSSVVQPNATKSGPGNLKSIVEAMDGEEYPEERDGEYADLLMILTNDDPNEGAVQPARGTELEAVTYQSDIKTGKNAGKKGTFVRWSHVDITPEQIAANLLLLGDEQAEAKAA